MESELDHALIELQSLLKEMRLILAWREIGTIPSPAAVHPVLRFQPNELDELLLTFGKFLMALQQARAAYAAILHSLSETQCRVIDRRLTQLELEAKRLAAPQSI